MGPILGPHPGPGILYRVEAERANEVTPLGMSYDYHCGCSEASLQEERDGQGSRALWQMVERTIAEFSRGGEAEGLGGPSVGSELPNLEVCKQDEPPR